MSNTPGSTTNFHGIRPLGKQHQDLLAKEASRMRELFGPPPPPVRATIWSELEGGRFRNWRLDVVLMGINGEYRQHYGPFPYRVVVETILERLCSQEDPRCQPVMYGPKSSGFVTLKIRGEVSAT